MVEMPTSTFDDGGKAERGLLSAITSVLEKDISTLDFFSLPLFPLAVVRLCFLAFRNVLHHSLCGEGPCLPVWGVKICTCSGFQRL